MKKWLAIAFISLACLSCASTAGSSTTSTPTAAKASSVESTLLPGVNAFLIANPQYGRALDTSPQPDWAKGKRQEVQTTAGTFLFYTSESAVVGAWKYEADGKRTLLFQKDTP